MDQIVSPKMSKDSIFLKNSIKAAGCFPTPAVLRFFIAHRKCTSNMFSCLRWKSKMVLYIRVADYNFSIEHQYEFLQAYCRNYIVKGEIPDFNITVTEEDTRI